MPPPERYGVGLVVGRFQPLHRGHMAIIEAALEACDEVIVAVGSSEASGTDRNPWSYWDRVAMLHAAFSDQGPRGDRVTVVGVPDLNDPPNWVAHARMITGPFDVVFGNAPETLDLFEAAGYPTVRPGLQDREQWQGSAIRAWRKAGDPRWMDAVPPAVHSVIRDSD